MGRQVVGLGCVSGYSLLVDRSLACVLGGLVRESRAVGPRQLGCERVVRAGIVAAGGLGQSSQRRDWQAGMLAGSRGVRHYASGQGLVTKLGMRHA